MEGREVRHLRPHGRRRLDDAAEYLAASRHDHRSADGGTRHNYTCKLCGLSFACTDATLARLLDLLAAHGVTKVNLKALNRLASIST